MGWTYKQIILDNYLLTAVNYKFRGQKVELFLYLPKGTLFKADETVQKYDRTENNFFNLHFSSSDYIYKRVKSYIPVNKPIYYWWYDPYLYGLDYVYVL